MQQESVQTLLTPIRNSRAVNGDLHQGYQEITCLKDIKLVLNSEHSSLVLFDIDNTLIKTAQQLGSDQWFDDQLAQRKAQGQSSGEAVNNTLPLYYAVQKVTRVQLLEESTPQLINELRNDGHMVFGFTSRGYELEEATRQQLKEFGINFGLAFDETNHKIELNQHSVYFDKGIIYCNGRNKGLCLPDILEYLRVSFSQVPESMVFIDDKFSNIQAVVTMAKQLKIPCSGFHFTRLANELIVNAGIVKQQEESFKRKILSNEDASTLDVAKRREVTHPGLQLLCDSIANQP